MRVRRRAPLFLAKTRSGCAAFWRSINLPAGGSVLVQAKMSAIFVVVRDALDEMRRLLVQASHAALHTRKDFALKRWTLGLAERVGKSKVVVALARKLAIVMHRMWVTGQSFQAFPARA